MRFDILTIFPHILDSYLNESILKRAQEKGVVTIRLWDIRVHATDKHKSVDDTPYGGGPGMIMKIEPVYRCLKNVIGGEEVEARVKDFPRRGKSKIVLMSPQGALLIQKRAEELAQYDHVVLLCGRYEGMDARVKHLVDEEISIGPYVLSGGELPAMVVVEAVTRLLPGVLGSAESLTVESYAAHEESGIQKHYIEYPQYTRPEIFEPIPGVAWSVPDVLLSGDHKKIEEWRQEKMK